LLIGVPSWHDDGPKEDTTLPRHANALILALVLAAGSAAHAKTTIVVHAGESIQAAIDQAPPGSMVLVEPGIYHETGATRAVTITRNGIRLIGKGRPGHPVVLEQAGTQTQGIWVSPDDTLAPDDVELPPCGVSGRRLAGFDLRGITVQGFDGFGVYLACVDGFDIRGVTARDDHTYSIFPVRSSHGRMTGNVASGTISDSCLYVGQDDDIVVEHNQATDCLIGLQIENSSHVRFAHNVSRNNTAGMIVDVLNGRQVKMITDNVVKDNVLADNNRPNTAPPDADTADLQPGIGLVVDGADATLVTGNTISGNRLAGMTVVGFCLDRPDVCAGPIDIDPNPDDNRFVGNRFDANTVDVIYLPGQGTGNCFARNKPVPLTSAGGALPACR
jgi:copper-binding protein NosD